MLPWATSDSETDPCCCECPVEAPPSGDNWFEITEEEFFDYLNGGTWSFDASHTQSESDSTGNHSSGSGSGTASGPGSGCFHSVSDTYTTHASFNGGPEMEFTGPISFSASLSSWWDGSEMHYYIQFSAAFWLIVSGSGSDTGYPPSHSITADGNSLATRGIWSPDWAGNSGYTNGSSGSGTATFTPS